MVTKACKDTEFKKKNGGGGVINVGTNEENAYPGVLDTCYSWAQMFTSFLTKTVIHYAVSTADIQLVGTRIAIGDVYRWSPVWLIVPISQLLINISTITSDIDQLFMTCNAILCLKDS